jgi:peptidoglycan hydrolase CwlO-like protein
MGMVMLGLVLVGVVEAQEDKCSNPGGLTDPVTIELCIKSYSQTLDAISSANTTNRQQLEGMQKQVKNLITQISNLDKQLVKLSEELFDREVKMGVQKELFYERVRRDYVRKRELPLLKVMFASTTARYFFQNAAYREMLANQDQAVIVKTGQEIADIGDQSEQLKTQKTNLAALQVKVDKQAEFLANEVAKADKYLSDLSGKVAALTARQQEILAERSGSFVVDIGDSELADDYNASIKGFRESAPGGSFAAFSFGAYTHRKGMSQYGARGRVASGQNYRQVLKAYYGKEPNNIDTGGNISVSGFGGMDFETRYLYGIAEVPSSWPKEVLKAQAVAARSYALRYKQGGQTICTTEACQVFRKSKADNPPAEWKQAVDETRGEVIEGVVTYFSSTAGGYLTTMGWDTTDGGGGGNFFEKMYDKIGGSPWAYKAWYTQGYSTNSDKCGRSNPWLNNEEMTDLVNAALVIRSGNGGESSRVTPISSCWGGNPYSMSELRQVAAKYGGISSVTSIVVHQGNGVTNEVLVNGAISISGNDFRKGFNLRAPGRMSIPQNGFSFFNIEKK